MPRPSAFDGMPEADYAAFSSEFASRHFKDVDGMMDWLLERGFEVKRGAVWRAGGKIKRRLQAIKDATQAAKFIVDSTKDDEASLSEAVISMVQSQMFDTLVALREAEDEDDPAERMELLGKAARASADVARASISTKKHRMDTQAKAKAAAATVSQLAKKGGLSEDVIRQIEEQVLGISR